MDFVYNFLPVYWIPQSRNISSITNATNAVVTTTQDHGYLDGLKIRLFLPSPVFSWRNEKGIYEITVLSSTTFSIPLDTSTFGTLSLYPSQVAQVIPVGENSLLLNSALKTTGYLNEEIV